MFDLRASEAYFRPKAKEASRMSQDSTTAQTFLTTSQVARLGEVSEGTVRYEIRNGRLTPDARTEGRDSLFSRSTAERWAAGRKASKTARQAGAAA